MAVDLEAAVTMVAALVVDIMAEALVDIDPVDSVVPDPEDLDITPIIPPWADGIGTDPGGTMAVVEVALGG